MKDPSCDGLGAMSNRAAPALQGSGLYILSLPYKYGGVAAVRSGHGILTLRSAGEENMKTVYAAVIVTLSAVGPVKAARGPWRQCKIYKFSWRPASIQRHASWHHCYRRWLGCSYPVRHVLPLGNSLTLVRRTGPAGRPALLVMHVPP